MVTNEIKQELISPKIMLGMIGLIALILPIVIPIGRLILDGHCRSLEGSISAYYHTGVRDVFVGMLCALAFAFFAYKGYDDRSVINDRAVGRAAAIFTLGVAFFPTSIDKFEATECIAEFDNKIFSKIHYISASLLFLSLAYFCFFLFTKSKNGNYWNKKDRMNFELEKLKKNKIYVWCGSIIIFCMLCVAIYALLSHLSNNYQWEKTLIIIKRLRENNLVFWLELIMIWSFAIAWLFKSDLADKLKMKIKL
jgi:hypothetical protein